LAKKPCPLYEILSQLVITETDFPLEDGFFGKLKLQEAYNIIFFLFLMENSILKIFGSVDVKITPDFCS
jgi:hypothetical protein